MTGAEGFDTWPRYVYWDVRVIDDSGDKDVVVAEYNRVLAKMFSDAKKIELLDENEAVVASFSGDADPEERDTHAVVTPQGVEILNCSAKDNGDVTIHLRPHGI